MALDVKVKISVSKPVGSVGFGTPLLLECGVTTSPVGYEECASLAEVMALGFAETDNIYKAASMVFAQENRPEKIAVCQSSETVVPAITAIVNKGWRQLVLVGSTYEATDYIAAADYIEQTGNKMMFLSMSATEFGTFKTNLANKKYDRTVIFVNATEYAAAALVGETAGRTAGSFTYKFKSFANVAAETYTDAEITALHEAGAFAYMTKAGDDVTTEGISQSGKYIDITDSIDYVIQNIEYRIQKVFNTTAKVTYDDRGIALLESATVSALQEAFTNGIIAVMADGSTPDYTVSFAPRATTTEADRESREYKYGTFKFALAGAIHYCEVEGEITY